MWKTGRIPFANTFSSTMPEHPWLLHQWVPATVYYLLESHGGIALLIIFKAILGACIFLVVYRNCNLLTGRPCYWAFLICTAACMMARVRFFERPYMFSALFLAILYGMSLVRSRMMRLLWIPLFMTIWANVHFEVLDGFVLMGCLVIGDWLEGRGLFFSNNLETPPYWRRLEEKIGRASFLRYLIYGDGLETSLLISVFLVLGSVTLINPNGIAVLVAPVYFYFDPFWKWFIYELQPARGIQFWLLACYSGIFLVFQILAWKDRRTGLLISSLVFGVVAFASQRGVLIFTIVSAPYFAFLASKIFSFPDGKYSRAVWLTLPLLWLMLFKFVIYNDGSFKFGIGYYKPYYPLGLYKFMLEKVPRQNLFNEMMYGGSILWTIYPEFRPFVDGRGEAYSMYFWKQVYFPLHRGDKEWKSIFRRYHVHAAIVANLNFCPSPLAICLHSSPDWALVYFDNNTLLFLERTSQNAEVINEYEYRILWPGDSSLSGIDNAPQQAELEALRALKYEPECIYARTVLARALLVNKQWLRAIEQYRILIELPGTGGSYWRDYGYALYMAGYTESARQIFLRLLAKQEECAFSYYMLHFCALREGKIDDALTFLRHARIAGLNNELYTNALSSIKQ